MSRLLLVRHGETLLQSSARYWGQTDVELSALGLKQSERLRDLLTTHRIDTIYSSDLRRALVTAQIIASKHRTESISYPELREINFGKLEGLTFTEISQRYPEITQSWVERRPKLKYPGGESLSEFIQRTSSFASRLTTPAPEQTILIVAHSGSLRLIICRLLDIEPQRWWQLRLDLASLSIVETNAREAVLSLLNYTAHLEEVTL